MTMIGKSLGSYTIEERLGAGGMAQVYRARHVHLDRDVAIKVMHAHLAEQEGLRERFLNEARANAALKHAGIVQIYDFDVANGVCYIAMEMLEGQSLEERAQQLGDGGAARFGLDEALAIVTAVGEALGYAHAKGVVHRDIKPSNIMITEDGRAVLTDFGLAAMLEQTRLTVDGTSAGTPSYMSPEQASGERGDHRADIYSLGVVLYQLLAGELPLQSETLVGMINKLLNEPAPRLADKVPDLPAHVSAAVGRALEKDPSRRFASLEEMLAALRDGGTDVTNAATAPTFDVPHAEVRAAQPAPPAGDAMTSGGPTYRPATAATLPRWGVPAAATLVIALGAWWMLGGGSATQERISGSGEAKPDSNLEEVGSMAAEVESMVPEGEADTPSMASMTGWFDAFDDNVHGWQTSTGTIARSLVDGEYEIDLRIGGQAVSAVAEQGGEFADLQYSSDGSLVEGQSESGYGLVFRRVDGRNYYVFAVNGLGQWSLWVLQDGAWRELRGLPQTWTPSDAIVVGGANRLSVTAVGARISGSVNGIELVSLDDSTFSSGGVGFYAASSRTANEARTRVRFDDTEVVAQPADGADAPSMVGRDGR